MSDISPAGFTCDLSTGNEIVAAPPEPGESHYSRCHQIFTPQSARSNLSIHRISARRSSDFSLRLLCFLGLEEFLARMDISTAHLILSYMEDHLRNEDRVDREWEALNEREPAASNQVGHKPDGREKKRASDAVPYDHCRVALNAANNRHGSDYINASFIIDHDPRYPAYIAAQSPLAELAADFWQLVWEQGSASLVLLGDCSEDGSSVVYWPIDETPRLYHVYEVRLISEHSHCQSFCVRSFYVRNLRSAETRSVAQFHFHEWPAASVPLSVEAFLEFRRKVNMSYRNPKSPPIVHCSDGAGRTGTFCLIDLVLNRLARGAREIDIAATLEHLRDQRPLMVHNKKQFEFALTVVALEINTMLK